MRHHHHLAPIIQVNLDRVFVVINTVTQNTYCAVPNFRRFQPCSRSPLLFPFSVKPPLNPGTLGRYADYISKIWALKRSFSFWWDEWEWESKSTPLHMLTCLRFYQPTHQFWKVTEHLTWLTFESFSKIEIFIEKNCVKMWIYSHFTTSLIRNISELFERKPKIIYPSKP